MMKDIATWLGQLRGFLDVPLLTLGDKPVTLWSVLYVLVWILLLFWLARRVQLLLSEKLLLRAGMDAQGRHMVGALVRYLMLLIGLLIIIQTAGIDLLH